MWQAVRENLREIERDMNYEELAVLRTIVMNRIKKKRDLAEVSEFVVTGGGW